MVIDFHSHVLPSIDDGSKDVEMSIEMLKELSHQHVDVVMLTPHFYAHRHSVDTYLPKREQAYKNLLEGLKDANFEVPKLYVGAEVAFFDNMSKASILDKLSINESKVLVVEMPFYTWDDHVIDEIETLIYKRNFHIIIAHLERYWDIKGNNKYIKRLLELPITVQINAESVESRKVLKLFKKGQAHILGTDAHNLTKRPPNLKYGRLMLKKKLGDEILEEIDRYSNKLLEDVIGE